VAIPTATARFAIAHATGVVKRGGRVDRILAEQEAVRRELALPDESQVEEELRVV
jgi:hypothetical protein